jgi:RND family efflux transporter MFP subunit
VAQAEAALAAAQLNFDRTASLIKQKFISQAALDKTETELKSAQAALAAARAGASQAATARSFAEVRAPLDGVVSRRLTEVGELATPGKPLLEMHDPSALRATGAVPQFVLARAGAIARATVVLPAVERSFTAIRVTLLPAADPRLLSTQVRADLPADLPKGVVPGIAAKILLTLPMGGAARLTLPAAALVRRGELTATYVVGEDGAPRLRQIRVGEQVEAGEIEVLSGLAAGERVQLNPLAR